MKECDDYRFTFALGFGPPVSRASTFSMKELTIFGIIVVVCVQVGVIPDVP
jgi:hypothetical protein